MQHNNQNFYGGTAVFPFLSLPMRAVYAVIAIILAAACLFIYYEQDTVLLFGLVFSGISALAALYRDGWEFNCTEKIAVYTIGLACFTHKKHYPFTSITGTETEQFSKGVFLKKEGIKGVIILANGDRKTICIFYPEWQQNAKKNWDTIQTLFNKK